MFDKFVKNSDPETLSPLVCSIWAEHFAKESNKPETTAKALEEYNQMWDNVDMDKGSWLTKMYPTTPKV
jgi:hypothetical protein